MMKAGLFGATALAVSAMTVAASAADLPVRKAPLLPPVVPVFTWTGFYAGFNAGYAFDTGTNRNNGFTQINGVNPVAYNGTTFVPVTVLAPNGSTLLYNNRGGADGFTGGGQIGYNYQFTPGSGVVIGIEADAQYLDFGARRNNAFTSNAAIISPAFAPINGTLSTLDFFGTVRGRLGYAFDRVLVYGTGGFAYASGGDQVGGFTAFTTRNDDFRTGWAAGGGVEYALPTDSFLNFFRSSAVTVKVEGLYVNLDRRNNLPLVGAFVPAAGVVLPVYDTGTVATNRRRSDEFVAVRAGLNYKFGTF